MEHEKLREKEKERELEKEREREREVEREREARLKEKEAADLDELRKRAAQLAEAQAEAERALMMENESVSQPSASPGPSPSSHSPPPPPEPVAHHEHQEIKASKLLNLYARLIPTFCLSRPVSADSAVSYLSHQQTCVSNKFLIYLFTFYLFVYNNFTFDWQCRFAAMNYLELILVNINHRKVLTQFYLNISLDMLRLIFYKFSLE